MLIHKGFFIRLLELLTVIYVPFKKSIKLYGSGFDTFSGHTKYEFLDKYFLENSYWVACAESDVKLLRQQNVRFVKKGTIKHFVFSLLANEYYITHNVSDVFMIKPIGCKVTNLWHGVAIKPIGFDSRVELKWIRKKLKENSILPYEKWDVFVAQNEHHKKIIQRAMRIPAKKIIVSTPKSVQHLKQTSKNKVELNKKLNILYVPTFRGKDDIKIYSEGINKILQYFSNRQINLLVKIHPLIDVELDLIDSNKVTLLDRKIDPFTLLSDTDILVSDYSSIIYDFEPLGKDIYLIHDDIAEFKKVNGGIYEIKLRYKAL